MTVKLISKAQLNNLTRELNLSKEVEQILGLRLKEKNFLKRIQHLHSTAIERKNLQDFYVKKILWFILRMCKAGSAQI